MEWTIQKEIPQTWHKKHFKEERDRRRNQLSHDVNVGNWLCIHIHKHIIHCYSLHLLMHSFTLGERLTYNIKHLKGLNVIQRSLSLSPYIHHIQFCWTSVPVLVKYASIVGLSDPPRCLCLQKYFSSGSWLKTSLRRYFTAFWRSRGLSSVKDLTACTDREIKVIYTIIQN